MKREFWAEFDLYGKLAEDEWQNKGFLDGFVEKTPGNLPNGWDSLDKFYRIQLLAASLASHRSVKWIDKKGNEQKVSVKDYARTGASRYKGKSGLLYWYQDGNYQSFLRDRLDKMKSTLGVDNPHAILPDLSIFPPGSWAVQVSFTLRKPYISRDDTDFYIIDNPVKKEWVFKVPYVAPSQWKGALRAAMVRELVMRLLERKIDEEKFFEERIRLYRLFGNEKDGTAEFLNQALARFRVETLSRDAEDEPKKQWEQRVKQEIRKVAEQFESKLREKGYRVGDIEGFQGYLHFYPTFFDKIGLEVINTHDRETGASVKGPIYFECVPAGTKGTFTLLYVPMKEIDEDSSKKDMEEVAKGLKAMLSEYGFGAKTSSGYGVADDKVDGRLIARFSNVSTTAVQPPAVDIIPIVEPKKDFLKYMNDAGEVKPEFQGSGGGGLMSNSEYKKHGKESGGSLSEFKKFRSWYLKYGKTWRESRHSQVTDQSENLNIFHRKLGSLTELIELANLIQSKEPDLNDGEGKNG